MPQASATATATPQPATVTAEPSLTPTASLKTWKDEPNGYGIQYPADWQPETPSQPGGVRFGGKGGYFEVQGVYPGSAGDAMRASLWNTLQTSGGCYGPLPAVLPADFFETCNGHDNRIPDKYPIYYPLEHLRKFVALKTNVDIGRIIFPIELPSAIQPTATPLALSSTPLPSTQRIAGFTLQEFYIQPVNPNEIPGFIIIDGPKPEIFMKYWNVNALAREQANQRANSLLAPFGYQIELAGKSYKFLRGTELIKDDLDSIDKITVSADGKNFAILLVDAHYQFWLAQNGKLTLFNPNDHFFISPVYAGSHLISLSGQWDVVVEQDGKPVYRIYTSQLLASPQIRSLFSFEGHWAVETLGTLIVDGEIWNTTRFPAEEIFDVQILDGKLFFFFRRDQQIGMYYDGQVLPLGYTAIHHDGCCGYGAYNPLRAQDGLAFFAVKEGSWYLVILKYG